MWSLEQRERYEVLSRLQEAGELSKSEVWEPSELVRIVEEEEARYLVPATKRIDDECLEIERQNMELKSLLDRRERLSRRLERFLCFKSRRRSDQCEDRNSDSPKAASCWIWALSGRQRGKGAPLEFTTR